jgi:hypothetical protein
MYPSTLVTIIHVSAHAGCDTLEEGSAELIQVLKLIGNNLLRGG